MIPLQLTLKNFLSYREAKIDFRGVHTACICGANGAGKSSLLEAITWVIWGESRASTEDEVIHTGADFVQVDYHFSLNEQVYRIIRSRTRGKNSSLDFQIDTDSGFRSLSGRRLKDTQAQIITYLKLDHDTFINSAYLRQGQADEFMKRSPGERKKILAELLKLNQYEALSEKAKDLSKEFKLQVQQLQDSLDPIEQKIAEKTSMTQQLKSKVIEIEELQKLLDGDIQQLQDLQAKQANRNTSEQQLAWQQGNYNQTLKEYDRLQKEQADISNNLNRLAALLDSRDTIVKNYQEYINLQEEEESFSQKLQASQEAQEQKQKLEQQLNQQVNQYSLQLQQYRSELKNLEESEEAQLKVLSQAEQVKRELEKFLTAHRQREELDKLHEKVIPLMVRKREIELDIKGAEATMRANLAQQKTQRDNLCKQIEKILELRGLALDTAKLIKELEKKQVYHKHIEDKGHEKKRSQEKLQYDKQNYEKQLRDLLEKLENFNLTESTCPVCQQELNEAHRHHVVTTNQEQQEEIKSRIWDLETQINLGERELQEIRNQYSQIKEELKELPKLQEKYTKYATQLESYEDLASNLEEVEKNIEKIQTALTAGNYSEDLQNELQSLNQSIANTNYDEQTHSLVRSEETRYKPAETKQERINEARHKLSKLQQDKPKLLAKIEEAEKQIKKLQTESVIKHQIDNLEAQIQQIGYDRSLHQKIKVYLKESRSVISLYESWKQAEENYPQEQQKQERVRQRIGENVQSQGQIQEIIKQLTEQINNLLDYRSEISKQEGIIKNKRQQLDHILSQKGQIEEKINQIDNLEKTYQETQKKIEERNKKYRIYLELSQAFGKNGIQLHMIENVLPQLEAETNQILGKLSSNQLHVQFITQKTGKSGSASKRETKLIDTLEININDAKGTRAYETYSGGEAFRINFSIRLALAKLLAHRAGIALQMLIVDEGFGTQDAEGCERLISAINAIADDFSCILTVTHMPQFKEAFQNRIEVRKTDQGSKIVLLS